MSDKDPANSESDVTGVGPGEGQGSAPGAAPSPGPEAGEAGQEGRSGGRSRSPFESLRGEVDRLFDEFDKGVWSPVRRSVAATEPFWRRELSWTGMPVADFVEKEDRYEIAAELPGMDEADVDVAVAGGKLTIKGEKLEEKEETKKDYHLQERRFGAFERRFPLPEDVDAERIEASFRKGVLKVVLPKTAESSRQPRKVHVKPG